MRTAGQINTAFSTAAAHVRWRFPLAGAVLGFASLASGDSLTDSEAATRQWLDEKGFASSEFQLDAHCHGHTCEIDARPLSHPNGDDNCERDICLSLTYDVSDKQIRKAVLWR